MAVGILHYFQRYDLSAILYMNWLLSE